MGSGDRRRIVALAGKSTGNDTGPWPSCIRKTSHDVLFETKLRDEEMEL